MKPSLCPSLRDDDNILHPNLHKLLDDIRAPGSIESFDSNDDKMYTFNRYNRIKAVIQMLVILMQQWLLYHVIYVKK